ncbi:MAG: TolC family protein [Gemmatimonadales bacterium]|nr:TolC family protein [Gemmatimonadales bacterium]
MTTAVHRFVIGTAVLCCAAATVRAQEAPSSSTSPIGLFDALELAVESHPALRAAGAAYRQADAQLGQAQSEWFPQLSARASLMQYQEPMLAYPLHELSATVLPKFDPTLIQGGVDLGWLVFDGGGRRARVGAARAHEEGAAVNREAVELQLMSDVTRAYLTVISTAGVLDALGEHERALGAERARVRQLLEQGQAAQVELLRVDAAIAQAAAERISTEAALDASERSLARLLDVDVERVRAHALTGVRLISRPVADRATLLDRLEEGNLDIVEAQYAATSADWTRRAARSAWFPRLEGVGSYGMWAIPNGPAQFEWQVGLRVSYPLFTGGLRSRSVAGASARAEAAQESLALARLRSQAELDRAMTSAREQHSRAEAVATAVQHLTEVARIEHLALEAGEGTQTEFLRAAADLHRARASLVQAEYGEIVALVELARTTGDLTVDWLRSTLETLP